MSLGFAARGTFSDAGTGGGVVKVTNLVGVVRTYRIVGVLRQEV